MKIIKKDDKYILENFGCIEILKRAEILACFLKADDVLCFENYGGNHHDEVYPDIVEERKEEDLEDYCSDHFQIQNIELKNEIEGKIKDLLITMIDEKVLKEMDTYELDKIKTELFNSFRKGTLDDISDSIYEQIKDIIHINIYKDKDPEVVNFIKERVRFVNSEWTSIWNKPERWDEVAKKYDLLEWYSVNGQAEIIKVIERNRYFFTCVVVDKNSEFNDYSYALLNYETESTYDLAVIEKVEGSFEEDVLPKIRKLGLKIC